MPHIRPAVPTDIPAIQALAQAAYVSILPDAQHRQRLLQRVYNARSLQRSIENTAAALYVAALSDQVVGMAHFGSPLIEECTERKEIHRLLVHPDHVRQGIGSGFIDAMFAHYQHDPLVRQLFVYVPVDDTTRALFYRKVGFQRLPTQDRDGATYFYRNVI